MTSTSQEILAALQRQLSCYQELAKLAELQHVHVQQEHTEALLDVLQKRQGVLNEIASLEKSVAPARQRWSQATSDWSPPLRQRAEGLLAAARKLLEEITTADRNDALVLQQRKLNVGRQLNKTTAAKTINRRYAAAAYGPAKNRMDFKS
jgi:hypothetical protein